MDLPEANSSHRFGKRVTSISLHVSNDQEVVQCCILLVPFYSYRPVQKQQNPILLEYNQNH